MKIDTSDIEKVKFIFLEKENKSLCNIESHRIGVRSDINNYLYGVKDFSGKKHVFLCD